ncbi:MAG: PD-(D/E)XK nuclease domain-containing protein [Lachnospiraceae bacterium]|nr:PD-(D/E)XK nuclease domain-containing protein [Lachnospiraceae bacterium]
MIAREYRRHIYLLDSETADNLRRLMQGQTIDSYIDTSVIYPEIKNNPITIYSFLVAAGYLKIVKKEELEIKAEEALEQIDQKKYFTIMKQEGINKFLKIGIVFHKKQVKLVSAICEG